MCVDRYLAIKKPFRGTSSHFRLYSILKVLIAVSLSTILSTPMFIFSHVINVTMPMTNNTLFMMSNSASSSSNWKPTLLSEGVQQFQSEAGMQGVTYKFEHTFSPLSHPTELHDQFVTFGNFSSKNFVSSSMSAGSMKALGDIYQPLQNWTSSEYEDLVYDINEKGANDDDEELNARCYLQAPNNERKAYFLVQYFAIFVIPGVLMVWLYSEMLREFKKVTAFFETSRSSTKNILGQRSTVARQSVNDRMSELNLIRKKKVTRLILIIILLFMICYLPFSSMVLFQSFYKFVPWKQKWYKLLHFVFVTLTYVNSCANPFLYTLLCKRYRIIFVKYFPFKNFNCYCFIPATTDPTPIAFRNRRENLVYSAKKRQYEAAAGHRPTILPRNQHKETDTYQMQNKARHPTVPAQKPGLIISPMLHAETAQWELDSVIHVPHDHIFTWKEQSLIINSFLTNCGVTKLCN